VHARAAAVIARRHIESSAQPLHRLGRLCGADDTDRFALQRKAEEMAPTDPQEERRVLHTVLDGLSGLDHDTRLRIIRTVMTFFGLQDAETRASTPRSLPAPTASSGNSTMSFTDRDELSAKQFLVEKAPRTDIERVVCLGFYLTHYRSTPHFRTLDISKLNTEAAQPKFSNPAYAVDNAQKRGLLVQANKGLKQVSAIGEQFVQALPDRDRAKEVLDRLRPRNKRRSVSGSAQDQAPRV
jgi:hypothetical protein